MTETIAETIDPFKAICLRALNDGFKKYPAVFRIQNPIPLFCLRHGV